MIAIWTCLIAGCLAAIPCPLQICKCGRLPQAHVFFKVAVCRMRWSCRRRGLCCRGWTLELISTICAILFSITLPVGVDTQVICLAVELIAGTACWTCWSWWGTSLMKNILIVRAHSHVSVFVWKRNLSNFCLSYTPIQWKRSLKT